jgi:hypothetical protein
LRVSKAIAVILILSAGVFAGVFAGTKLEGALPTEPPPIGYHEIVYFYLNGKYVNNISNGQLFPTLDACTDDLAKAMITLSKDPEAPEGAALRGKCLPILAAPVKMDLVPHQSGPVTDL